MESAEKNSLDIKNGINNLAENLTLRKDIFGGCGQNETDNQKNIENISSPAHSGGAYSSSGTHSPMAGHFLMPFCGLSGAITAIPTNAAAAAAAAALEYDKSIYDNVKVKENINVKVEPLSPTKDEILATVAMDTDNQVDEDWKLKLSMQFISNTMLKERLINNLPFSAGYNSNK